jgi:hypothetical protein
VAETAVLARGLQRIEDVLDPDMQGDGRCGAPIHPG